MQLVIRLVIAIAANVLSALILDEVLSPEAYWYTRGVVSAYSIIWVFGWAPWQVDKRWFARTSL